MKKQLFSLSLLAVVALWLAIATPHAQTTTLTGFATNTPSFAAPTSTPVPTLAPPVSSTPQPVQIFEAPECRYVEGQPTSQACRDLIAQYPKPVFNNIPQDGYTLDNYSFWRVGPQPVNTYDAPNGGVVGQIPQGFNFVRVVSQVDGWIQAQSGGWINKDDAYYVRPSYFTGVLLPEGWNQPFGWILDTTGIYASLTPGGKSTAESGLIPLHYQMFNIFAEAQDEEGWTWYMVGVDQWVKQVYMTVIKPIERPEGVTGRWVAIDLFEQSLVAYEDDRPVFATLISTGLPGTETNEGLFTIWARLERDSMSGSTGAPNAYDLQSVPWVQYFDGSISLHGTYWHDLFGYRRSRGCVNLSISDSRWVYQFFNPPADAPNVPSYVYVHSSDEYR